MSRQRERKRRRERGAQHEERRAPGPRPAMLARTPGLRLVLLLTVLVGGASGSWALMHRRSGPPAPPPISTAAMTESTRVASDARDWEGTLHWARALVAAEPANPAFAVCLGMVWHDYSFLRSRYGRDRPATRTSLERIEMESRALALIDSAATAMRSDEQWAEAMSSAGQVYETLGLPLEALQHYLAVRQRRPSYTSVLPRIVFVVKSLREPLTVPKGWWAQKNR
jgi:hypothetical protein